jgi:hypothetical protein
MKKYLMGLMVLALLGGNPLRAQTPAPVVIMESAGPYCGPTHTTCVPEHYVKKTDKVVYSSTCEDACLCYSHGLFKGCGCDSGHCERPHMRKFLVKKIQTCEQDAVKCVPSQEPVCAHGRCFAGSACAGTMAAPVMVPATVESVPTPMPPAESIAPPKAR